MALLGAGCVSTPLEPDDAPRPVTIHVVSHGWHTGIVLPVADIPESAWPERPRFAGARYVEVGWGDRDYYTASDPGLGLAIAAAVVPDRGVLHLVGLHEPPRDAFPASEVVALPITRGGLGDLVAHVRTSYERDADGEPVALGPGLYGDSRFYGSTERFHMFNTCNQWTARALRIAGVPVSSTFAWSADTVIDRARRASERLRSHEGPATARGGDGEG